VVNYDVTVVLDETDPAMRPGMTASAAIVVERRENVLLAPNRAIKSSGKTKIITLMQNDRSITTTVTLGLVGESYSEIVSGLKQGDTVVVPGTTTAQRAGQGMGGAVFIEGGGGAPPEGFRP
jgi:multidrug efflux pump subunit AcrA (membrane-fusion protein)